MKKIGFLILVLIISISCDDDENGNVLNLGEAVNEEETQDVGFFNLVVGNSWSYEIFQRIGQTEEFESANSSFIREITNEEIINGETI